MKAIHNWNANWFSISILFLMFQRYENESNSQLPAVLTEEQKNCFWCFKDMKMKAIHNCRCFYFFGFQLFLMFQRYENESNSQHVTSPASGLSTVSDVSKIWKWKQFTTAGAGCPNSSDCFWCFKDMKMKAIHNCLMIFSILIVLFLMFQRYENESNSQR